MSTKAWSEFTVVWTFIWLLIVLSIGPVFTDWLAGSTYPNTTMMNYYFSLSVIALLIAAGWPLAVLFVKSLKE